MNTRKILISEELNNIIKDIQNCFRIKNVSEAVRLSVNICIWHHDVCNSTTDYDNLKNKVEKKVRENYNKKEKKVSFRISDDLLQRAKNIYQTKDPKDKNGITFTISCCLLVTHLHILNAIDELPPFNSEPLTNGECLFYRPGQKTNNLLKKITNLIDEIQKKYDCDTFVEPFAGTANVSLHLETPEKRIKIKKIFLNDGEFDIINLLSIIRNQISILIIILLRLPVNKQTFNIFKMELKNNANNFIIEDIDRAAKFYYFNLLSGKGNGSSYVPNATKEILIHNLISLIKISKIIQNTVITQKDIFTFLEEIINRGDLLEKIIIYLDPPYIGTEYYYKVYDSTDKNFHEKLRDSIITLKNRGAKIIISYRATVTSSNKNTNNTEVQSKLDKLYKSQGFFIQFKKARNNQIEILLSSVEVSGSVPYDCRISDLIEKHVK